MSNKEQAFNQWQNLADRMVNTCDGVEFGKMMSAPAMTYRGKVFAFYSTKGGKIGMGFKLGREYDFASLDHLDWQHLSPFKTKPPMRDWIVCSSKNAEEWGQLAFEALEYSKKILGENND